MQAAAPSVSRRLLARLRDVMAGGGTAEERLDKAVTPAPDRAVTVSLSRYASSRATTTAPGLRALVSCAVGPRTFSSTSAPASTALMSLATIAPAAA